MAQTCSKILLEELIMSWAQMKWVTKVCCQMGENDGKINVVMWKMLLLCVCLMLVVPFHWTG